MLLQLFLGDGGHTPRFVDYVGLRVFLADDTVETAVATVWARDLLF